MSDERSIDQFPDIKDKLAAPAKKSLFERQKAEAEAKRLKEEEETLRIYREFKRQFDSDSEEEKPPPKPENVPKPPPRGPRGPAQRHFASSSRNSGPGTLGPVPGLSNRRGHGDVRQHRSHTNRNEHANTDSRRKPTDVASAFNYASDDEDDKDGDAAAPKQTLQLLNLPLDINADKIRDLIADRLKIDSIHIEPNPNEYARKQAFAIVTLALDTPGKDIDATVSRLQNKYLGFGWFLNISRHLASSTNNLPQIRATLKASMASLPFGATRVVKETPRYNYAPPPSSGRQSSGVQSSSKEHNIDEYKVFVKIPEDIRQIRHIHIMVERVLKYGIAFEALIMSRPEVQYDVHWAFLWDARSTAGVWYRWRLWELITGTKVANHPTPGQPPSDPSVRSFKLFEDSYEWVAPEYSLPFEFVTSFKQIANYEGEDTDTLAMSEDERDRSMRRTTDNTASTLYSNEDSQSWMSPLAKARFIWNLRRLPTSTAKLTRGQVARVTCFALKNAKRAIDEIVEMLVSNIRLPFQLTEALEELDRSLQSSNGNQPTDAKGKKKRTHKHPSMEELEDFSSAVLVSVHILSDVLMACTGSGVPQAWKYRTKLETALTVRKTFVWLGRLERELGWGLLKAEKWKRSIHHILSLWERNSILSTSVHKKLVEDFDNALVTPKEKPTETEKVPEATSVKFKKTNFVSIGQTGLTKTSQAERSESTTAGKQLKRPLDAVDSVDSLAEEDIDGVPLEATTYVNLKPASLQPQDSIDHAPSEEDDDAAMEDIDGVPVDLVTLGGIGSSRAAGADNGTPKEPGGRVKFSMSMSKDAARASEKGGSHGRNWRPRASDMFADSE